MGTKKKKPKRANTDHIAHQVGVSGVGAHRNKKKYTRKNKHKEEYKKWL